MLKTFRERADMSQLVDKWEAYIESQLDMRVCNATPTKPIFIELPDFLAFNMWDVQEQIFDLKDRYRDAGWDLDYFASRTTDFVGFETFELKVRVSLVPSQEEV